MLAGGAIEALSFLTSWWAGHGLITDPGSLRFVSLAAWLSLWLAPLPWPLVLVAPLVLFPDGRARSQRWQWFLVVVSAVVATLVIATAILAVPAAIDHPVELLDTAVRGRAASEWAIRLSSAARTVGFVAAIVALGGVLWARRRTVGLLATSAHHGPRRGARPSHRADRRRPSVGSVGPALRDSSPAVRPVNAGDSGRDHAGCGALPPVRPRRPGQSIGARPARRRPARRALRRGAGRIGGRPRRSDGHLDAERARRWRGRDRDRTGRHVGDPCDSAGGSDAAPTR